MTKVDPMVAYSTYMAIKLHFQPGTYDAFKFNFKGPQRKREAFAKSNDRFAYEKLAKKYPSHPDLILYYVANVLDSRTWVRDMTDEVYQLWQAKMQRLTYQFNTDMSKLCDYALNHELTFDQCLEAGRTNEVPILKLMMQGSIQVESVIIVDVLVDFIARINKKTLTDPLNLLSDKVYMMRQYKPFLVHRINNTAAKNSIINLFTEM